MLDLVSEMDCVVYRVTIVLYLLCCSSSQVVLWCVVVGDFHSWWIPVSRYPSGGAL